jgi:hypothetical protein
MADDTIGGDFEEFEEEVGDVGSVGEATIGRNGGGAVLRYYCLSADLGDRIDSTLETVAQEPRGSDGGLQRTNPLACPIPEFKHFFASRISGIKGVGRATKETSDAAWLEAPGPDYYADYPLWTYAVQFDPRPYALLDDDSIDTESITWYDFDGGSNTTPCATEWRRNTVVMKGRSTVEAVTAQFGAMKLRLGGATADDKQLMAMPSLMIPKAQLIVKHIGVPQWWHTSPVNNYDALLGTCNQLEFLDYSPGSLVLMEVQASDPYSPPRPELDFEEVIGAIVQDKIVDLTLVFDIYTRDPVATITPTNGNDICGPANALPNIDGKFYYATTVVTPTDSAADGRPRFRSGVHQFLFRSPVDG